MRQKTGCGVALAAALAFAVLPAMADMPAGTISTFNQALQNGDAAVIVEAAKVFGAAAVAHPEDRQAPVAAFEAANQLCLRNACAEAVPMAGFLGGLDDAALPVSRAEVEVLAAFAGWSVSAKDKAADSAFRMVLDAHVNVAPSLLTIAAFEAFCAQQPDEPDWEEVARRATLASSHLQQVRDILPARWATAELLSITAAFNADPKFETYDRVSDLNAWVLGKRRDKAYSENLRSLDYQTMAWSSAMSAFFRSWNDGRSKYRKKFKDAEARAEAIKAGFESKGWSDEPGTGRLPFCSGEVLAPPKPSYPKDAARKGYVGAVIIGISFKDGRISGTNVLAAVPDQAFERVSIDSVEHFRWVFDETPRDPECTATKENAIIIPLEYVMQ